MAQDDIRENKIVDLFNLERPEGRVRHGTDAILRIDGHTLEFELKSTTTKGGSLSTVRDFGPDHITKWKEKHWIIAVYRGGELAFCRYASPAAMASWIEEKWRYVEADFRLSQHVPALIGYETMEAIVGRKDVYTLEDAKRLHKAQYRKRDYMDRMDITRMVKGKLTPVGYSPERMLQILRDRAAYVIKRGATLNNPHISAKYFKDLEEIKHDHAARLRVLVREWLAARQPQARVPEPAPRDTPSAAARRSR